MARAESVGRRAVALDEPTAQRNYARARAPDFPSRDPMRGQCLYENKLVRPLATVACDDRERNSCIVGN